MGIKKKLLIIEDDADLVRALQLYFSASYQVITAANGLEGLQALYNERPDVVILDIAMPKMDGWE
ncbi:MAG: response regulator, partial [Candidatus Hadarchaeum sp.]